MRILITDDEPIAQDILETYISKIPGMQLAGKCRNAIEAYRILSSQPVDVLLLDINMPEITGMDFIKSLKAPPLVIFTTAYTEYAIESYELNAIDYLLKPISFERFLKAIQKANDVWQHQQPATKTPDNTVFIKADGKLVRIDLTQLLYAEALRDYIQLHTTDGKKLIHCTMKSLEETLAPYAHFIRVQKSYIVNIQYITEADGNTLYIKGQPVSIGNTYKEQVLAVLNKYRLV
ncbi:DNA-binding response regulator [Chitinophagaceae bacterium IBVUCB1]|nr:DNA-binding response regulator [Chitinophagaceae bacterium IBVUCB1]